MPTVRDAGEMQAGFSLGRCVVTGIVGTLFMDVSSLLWTAIGVRGLDPKMFGKWMDALRRGHLVSENLEAAPPSQVPPVLGLAIHYGIGITLATVFVVLLRRVPSALERPLVAGGIFGISTSVFAWFVMFPSMGFGAFGVRPPDGISLFGSSLLRHFSYGLGLGLVAQFWLARHIRA